MRVLVVDDSTLFRKVVRDAVQGESDIEVVGTAANGRIALEKIRQLQPDLVTLDVEMPELNGMEVLRELQAMPSAPAVILLSALTADGAALTTKALRLGAFDFILKPRGADFDDSTRMLRKDLIPKIRGCVEALRGRDPATSVEHQPVTAQPHRGNGPFRPEVITIGVSTGGPAALGELLPQLPGDLPIPVTIVQHMPPMFTRSLADDLNEACALRVQEGEDGMVLKPGEVYIAPGGKQMKVVGGRAAALLQVADHPPERNCRPSVDYLFRSLSFVYGGSVLAVVMTGMGDDGTRGCRLLKRQGARILAQDEASCVVYGMPRWIVEEGLADGVHSLQQLSSSIISIAVPGTVPCR